MKVSISWLKELVSLNCSVRELVILLPQRTIGIKETTGQYIELDMKGYNRADLLSLRGVAREIFAVTGSKLAFEEPQEAKFVWNQAQLPISIVEIQKPPLSPFYTITKITGLKVKKSPSEWVKKLEESGMRSVNNITDITNLVMLEFGQPLHAFDARAVKDESISVRTAGKSERITTLDRRVRDLEQSDLLIADPQNALGLAGVMGGKDSEVNQTTTTILLEAAIFDPVSIRKTAARLSLPSEASKRFQHGLTKKRLLQALNAAIKMYQDLGGQVISVTMKGNFEDVQKQIILTENKLKNLVGIKIPPSQVESYLKNLGFHPKGAPSNYWRVTVPYWRLDVEIEEDVIEEVTRMYGYEKIPAQKVTESKPLQKEDPIFKLIPDLKSKLANLGLTEVQTYSFYSTQVLEALSTDKKGLVKIANPISSETQYLKDTLWPSLAEVVGKNIRKGFKDIAIFEIGKVFQPSSSGNPLEYYKLAIALCNKTDNPLSELHLLAKSILTSLGVNLKHSPDVHSQMNFHPKRFLFIEKDSKQIGQAAEVHLRVLNKLGIEKRVAVLEMNLHG
ncbi:phenylalanine--tRNA ligase subunit beta [Candidatus Daviesbacteria bacterium]|nr:phenylalanine--tRNA ligase subunit beta [Candidatus Daviesbacteria bacterium]